jgi:hypothetical protein
MNLEETLDKDKLKTLYQSGVPVEGVNEATYVCTTQMAASHSES